MDLEMMRKTKKSRTRAVKNHSVYEQIGLVGNSVEGCPLDGEARKYSSSMSIGNSVWKLLTPWKKQIFGKI